MVTIIGLTGGIATGKSTVSKFLADFGAHIVDADRIAREVVEMGRPAWRKVVDHFGEDILLPDGSLDRVRLGDIVFHQAEEKKVLDGIVHPEVFREMKTQTWEAECGDPEAWVVLDVPLLIEAGTHRDLAEVILVYVPEAIQLNRLMARDRLSEADALARIRSQMPIEEKRAYATIIIDNSSSLAATRRRTQAVMDTLLKRQVKGNGSAKN